MAGHCELLSFLTQLCHLWSSGINARLAVECQAGQATVNLQLDLGLPHGHPQERPQQKLVGPSRLGRCARRAQARSEAAVNAFHVQATAAEDAAEKQNNTKAKMAPAPTLTKAAPQVTEAALQAAGQTHPTVDVAAWGLH